MNETLLRPRTVQQSTTEMTEIVLPSQANALGTIFGGTVMSWIDICLTRRVHPLLTCGLSCSKMSKTLTASVRFSGRSLAPQKECSSLLMTTPGGWASGTNNREGPKK